MGQSKSFLVAFLGVLVLAVVVQAQDQSGFISIACGAPDENYTEPTTRINYTSDANFINTGVSGKIISELRNDFLRNVWYLRSFPNGKRNCYKINITRGSKYLIRTSFLYGNYDGLNLLPQFDLLLGANRWATITISNASRSVTEEIIHVPSLDYIQICLVDTGHGTPFISTIVLRTLTNDIYVTESGSLENYYRWDLGSEIGYRYPYDVYDRFWSSYGDNNDWTQQSNASILDDSIQQNIYKPAAIVMSTTVTPANVNAPLVISWEPEDPTEQFYVYMHFMEIELLETNQTRQFNITVNGESSYPNFSPSYLTVDTIFTPSAISGKEITCSLEMTKNSTLPPIINAMEIYRVIKF